MRKALFYGGYKHSIGVVYGLFFMYNMTVQNKKITDYGAIIGLIGNMVKDHAAPATVRRMKVQDATEVLALGRRMSKVNSSQETCHNNKSFVRKKYCFNLTKA